MRHYWRPSNGRATGASCMHTQDYSHTHAGPFSLLRLLYCAFFIVPSLLYLLCCAFFIVPSLLCLLYCAFVYRFFLYDSSHSCIFLYSIFLCVFSYFSTTCRSLIFPLPISPSLSYLSTTTSSLYSCVITIGADALYGKTEKFLVFVRGDSGHPSNGATPTNPK